MSKEWFIYQDNEQKGPFTDSDFKKMALNGKIKPDSLVWSEGMVEWSAAEAVEGLLPKDSTILPPITPVPVVGVNNAKQTQPINPSVDKISSPLTAARMPAAGPGPQKKQLLMKIAIITLVVLTLLGAGTIIYSNYLGVETPISTEHPTGDRENYLSYRTETHTNLTCAFILFEELMKNPLYTAEWEADLQASMAAIMVICNDILSSSAPSEFRDSHELLQESAVDYYQAITSFIDLLPEQAKDYLRSGDQKYSASTSLLR